jgi:hypothetical protein
MARLWWWSNFCLFWLRPLCLLRSLLYLLQLFCWRFENFFLDAALLPERAYGCLVNERSSSADGGATSLLLALTHWRATTEAEELAAHYKTKQSRSTNLACTSRVRVGDLCRAAFESAARFHFVIPGDKCRHSR